MILCLETSYALRQANSPVLQAENYRALEKTPPHAPITVSSPPGAPLPEPFPAQIKKSPFNTPKTQHTD
jgi:hypothetical protein